MSDAVSDGNADSAFLGVERSVTGKRWRARDADERLVMTLCQKLELPELVARVVAARGIELDDAEIFLNPTLKVLLPDPAHLIDMAPAVERIIAAINGGETIAVLGDYDVDGATSAALLVRFFSALGRVVPVYIPDRQKEGYGPNLPALMKLKEPLEFNENVYPACLPSLDTSYPSLDGKIGYASGWGQTYWGGQCKS